MLSATVIEWTKQWKQEGKLEGLIEGKREGKLEGKLEGKREGKFEGKLEALERLLTKRFGALPDDIRNCLSTVTIEQLDTWFDCALDSTDLESIFKIH